MLLQSFNSDSAVAFHNRVCGNVTINYTACAYNAVVADFYAFKNNGIGANPAVTADFHLAHRVTLLTNELCSISEFMVLVINFYIFAEIVWSPISTLSRQLIEQPRLKKQSLPILIDAPFSR